MKINLTPRVAVNDPDLQRSLKDIARQVNGLSEGLMAASYNAMPTAPTTGDHAQGDYVKNTAPIELGAVASKYVIHGWICVAGGTPGTWMQDRRLTGN